MASVGFRLGVRRRTRRPGLTPMIDVVFLLLVFFMLASRFGGEGAASMLGTGQGSGGWSGPPRLAEVHPGGAIRVNGLPAPDLAAALSPLVGEGPEGRLVVLRAAGAATVQDVVDAALALSRAGFADVALAP
ncbi:MAG: biopolymer transport protein ExbD [Paracoccaceae bacterium]